MFLETIAHQITEKKKTPKLNPQIFEMKRDRGRGKTAAAWEVNQKQQADAGMDELFAVLGYKVKSSDMADVADKLEQLDMAMAATTTTAGEGVPVLSADAVYYNPSDLSGLVDTMSCALGIGVNSAESGDLRAIPGGAVLDGGDCKRIKTGGSPPPPSSVLVDSQEAGVRLVHALMACAEAVEKENMKLADALVKHVGVLAVSQAGAMRKVATYFAEALARRIYRIQPIEPSCSDLLQMHFYETAPYLKFAHFTANQALLEAFAGADRVHVLDFSLNDGMQWPALMQALALRPGGPPAFKLTGIGPSQPENPDALQEVGWKLTQVAETIGVEFEFRGLVVDSLADLDFGLMDIDRETVAVNSVFEMHRLLARPGSIERVLGSIRAAKPKIVTMVEQEADHNGAVFVDRFNEALHYYSTMFDSLESVGPGQPERQDLVMTEVYLGRQICNVVACDGPERVERHEPLARWRVRMGSAGFGPVHMGSNAFKQASILLALFAGGDGYRVEENEGCLMLGWHTRPLIAASAWRVSELTQ